MTSLEAALDQLRRFLAHHGKGDGRSLWVLPTTARSLEFIKAVMPSIAPAVLAPVLGDRHGLQAFVDRLSDARIAISFADQLTSPLEAPWLVEWENQRTFLSHVEYVAQAELGFRLSVWTTNRFLTLPWAAGEIHVGRALRQHLVSCEHLGDEWLASAAQCHRSPGVRIEQSSKRLQLFRSAVLASSMVAGLTLPARDALERSDAIRKSLSSAEVAG